MLEKLRKMLIDAGIDPAVGSIDYWGTQLEYVLLDMYDQGAADEREACAITAWSIWHDLYLKHHDIREVGSACATAIRARGNHG